jgi:deoxyribose-phosphate aldolase
MDPQTTYYKPQADMMESHRIPRPGGYVSPGTIENVELQKLAAEIAEDILARAARPGAARPEGVARLIDHTLLKPEATGEQVRKACHEALEFGFAAVCVNPCFVPLVAAELAGSRVRVATVAGFPLGASMTELKVRETEAALRCGAQEIDMVIHTGALRSGEYDAVKADIQSVVDLAHAGGALVKVIIEAAVLDDKQKAVACTLAKLAGADFVKTSTGFGPGGATAHDVALMRATVGPEMGVKAAGGIRSLDDLLTMTRAGANRIGTSAGVAIMEAAGR